MPISRSVYHFRIYYSILIIFAVSLPLAPFIVSISQFLIVLNWLLERNFHEKFKKLKSRKAILFVISILIIHAIGMIYSENLGEGFKDLKIKLPLLVFPIIIGTSQKLNYAELKKLLLFFSAAVVVSTIISIGYFLGYPPYKIFNFAPKEILDIRDISIFIHHIRLSLLINIAIFSLFYYLLIPQKHLSKTSILIYILSILWLISFLFVLQSITGIIILFIAGIILFANWLIKLKRKTAKVVLAIVFVMLPVVIISYLTISVKQFYNIDKVDFNSLEKTTALGNPYWHDLENKQIENGHYVGLYLSEKEIKTEWDKLSEFKYNGKDLKGQAIKYTLIRFLSSRGLRKDADGIKKLSENDIKLIEDGHANYKYGNKLNFNYKIYQIIWQIDVYYKGGNPSGHSVTQRIEYLKAAIGIIKDHFLIGVGSGDLQKSYDEQYKKMDSRLSPVWWLRAHNQYVTFILAFGILGFLWIMFSLIYPVFLENKTRDFFFIMFFIIAFLSMLNEDTLETQAGASFFAFFYSLFLFGNNSLNRKTV